MSIPVLSNTPSETRAPRANVAGRIFAFLAGLFLLLIGSLISFGLTLVGAVGMGIATLAKRQRRQHLSRLGGWIASVVSVAIACVVIAFVVAEAVPSNTWTHVQVAMDSASAASAKQPPPAWIERMYPGMSQRAAAQHRLSGSAQVAFEVAGFGFVGTLFAGFCGTLGWFAGLLLGFGVHGEWPGTSPMLVKQSDGG